MSSEAKERWKRLEALGAKGEIPTPEGEAKMSAVIVQLAEPLLKQHATNAKRAETIISLTVAAWNSSMFPPNIRSQQTGFSSHHLFLDAARNISG